MGEEAMEHCYVLNEHTDYRLAWTVRGRAVDIHVSANAFVADSSSADSSAATANQTWVGIGFRPQGRGSSDGIASPPLTTGTPSKFGMQGADIVAGFAKGGDAMGDVRTYYASLYTG